MSQARLDPLALVGVGHVLLDRSTQLRRGDHLVFAFHDLRAHAHHLCERPITDALPV